MEEQTEKVETQQGQLELETVTKEQYDSIVSELEEVKGKLPKELSEEEKSLQNKQQELWQKEKAIELKAVQLDKFADFIHAGNPEELSTQIKQFQLLLNEIKMSIGYVPNDHKKTDEYSSYEKSKDTKGMIGTKLANLFK